MDRKRTTSPGRFHLGSWTRSVVPNKACRKKTEPDRNKVEDLIRLFTEYYLPKRNTYHNRGDFFWAIQTEEETPEEFWRELIKIEKECNFSAISAEHLLISKYMTAIIDKNLRDKIMKQKTLELKKMLEIIENKTHTKKKQEKHNTGGVNFGKGKTHNHRRTDTKNGEFDARPKPRATGNRPCRFCGAPKRTPLHKFPALETNCKKCGKRHYAKACRPKYTNN